MTEYLENPRRVPRDPVRCRASLVLGTGAIETTTEDIGARGCQIILPRPEPLARGAIIALTLQAPRFPTPLRIQGRIAWVSPEPPCRVGIAYAAGGLTDAARWMETFRQTSPELFVREKRAQERVAVDAMCFLGVAPKVAEFTEDELTVLRTIGSGARVGELRTALSRTWPRMQRAFFALFSRGLVTLSRAASAHPVTWKAILGAPAATPAPGVTIVDDELVLESLLERSMTPPPEPAPAPEARRAAPPGPRRGAPASPSPSPSPSSSPRVPPPKQPSAPPPIPSVQPAAGAVAPAIPTPTPSAVPPPLPPSVAASRAASVPGVDAHPHAPAPDFQGAGVGWRNGARGPRSPEADAVYRLGLAELEGKRAQQAMSFFRRALTLAPGDPEIARALGRAMLGG